MDGNGIFNISEYSPAGDVVTLVISLVLVFLLFMTYLHKSFNYRIFQGMLLSLILAVVSNLGYYHLAQHVQAVPHYTLYMTRFCYHFFSFSVLYLFILYLIKPLHLERKKVAIYIAVATLGFAVTIVYEFLQTLIPFGYRVLSDGTIFEGLNIFVFTYAFFMVVLIILMLRFRVRLVKQLFYSVIGTCIISMLVLAIQSIYRTVTYTSLTLLFPIIMVMYLIHANPYDIDIGAVGAASFYDSVRYAYKRKREMIFISLLLPDFEDANREFPREFKDTARKFYTEYFSPNTVLFQVSDGRIVLAIDIASNPSYENGINRILNDFEKEYELFHMDFKIVITKNYDEVGEINDYVGFMEYMEDRMSMNDVHFADNNDVEDFFNYRYVLGQLEDINAARDLDDPRVHVYCQPVFNVLSGKYDTAEALMRLSLERIPMVYPDVFIPLAEQSRCIHMLSLIILNKTCKQIRKMLDLGIEVNRISVNFSVVEVLDDNFCEDVERIIQMSDIPYEKIAIEITESQNENDFMIMKGKINELRQRGIKFYLDDFGTGYSNFERIMELPFDIIKFDRSLVLSCGSDEKAEMMVSYLAKMFDSMDYSVLYEGVETDRDEEKCKQMFAKYLQGYKYSRPIPIEKLDEYFEHTA